MLVALGVLVTGVWSASQRWWFGYSGDGWDVICTGGVLERGAFSFVPSGPGGWRFSRLEASDRRWAWSVSNEKFHGAPLDVDGNLGIVAYCVWGGGVVKVLQVVLWPLALGTLVGGGRLV
ncbi:MAG: hypothetical protein ACREJO_16845 [Phycisphaerales bacterium]